VANLLRYALGGDGTTPLAGLLPEMQSTPTVDGLSLTLIFYRVEDPEVTYSVFLQHRSYRLGHRACMGSHRRARG
jgi:hypothetical protein